MIGIIGAMQPEVHALKEMLEAPTVERVGGLEFCTGRLQGKRVVIAQCGVGKVFAAICAQAMILRYRPTCILNTGVAGSLDPALGVLDIAIATDVVQHDMNTSPLGDPLGLISGVNMVYFPADPRVITTLERAAGQKEGRVLAGTVASGDLFVSTPAQKQKIHERFNAIACEMEGAAIGHVCYVNGTPFGVLRVISDSATGDGAMEYSEFLPQAANRSIAIVGDFVKEWDYE